MGKVITYKIVLTFFVTLFSFTKSFAQSIGIPQRQPKEIIVKGKIDSYGYFKFFNHDFLIDFYTRTIKDKTDGDFYFEKEMYNDEKKLKYRVVYSYYEYSYSTNLFGDSLSFEQIKFILNKTDSFSKSDSWMIKNIVDSKTFNAINALTEHQFFNKYLSKFGIFINYKDEQEKLAVVLRLLQMNISVGVVCLTGDLMIPTTAIAYPVW